MLRPWPIAICATILFLGTVENNAEGQYAEPCRAPGPSDARGSSNSTVERFVDLVPSLCVSERYDSNVFFRPSTAGLKREDYVTSVNPMLRVNHIGNYAAGFLEVGGVSETYVNNSGLNFLGSNGTLFLNLDNAIKRIMPHAGLIVSDALNYSPLPPGFVNPVAGTNPGAPSNIQDVFSQGILFQRSNRITNSGTVSASYETSASSRIDASYSHSVLRFLSSSVGLFNTTTQMGTVGGSAQLSRLDRLIVRYSFAHSEFGAETGPSFFFKAHTATAGWSRVLTPSLTVEASGGGILIEPGRTTYAANASMTYDYGQTRTTVSYARSAFPSFIGVPTQVVGDVVSLSVTQEVASHWQFTGSANYSHSSGIRGADTIKFDSYGGSWNLAYLISRIWTTSVGYSYIRFDRELGASGVQFDRHVMMLSVRATWE